MRNISLICVLLVLQGCAPLRGDTSLPPLPEAVINPPPASTPGSLTESLQNGLQESLDDLAELLSRLRKLPPPIAPAPHGDGR